jgi:hypothetical protein
VTGDPAARPDRRIMILNRRYPRRWRYLSVVVRLIGLYSVVFYFRDRATLWGYAAAGLAYGASEIGLQLFGPRVLRWDCLDWVRFGDELKMSPRRPNLKAADIERLELARDPAEDYDDSRDKLCELTVIARPRTEYRLLIDSDDAARLTEWAAERGIPVADSREQVEPRSARERP